MSISSSFRVDSSSSFKRKRSHDLEDPEELERARNREALLTRPREVTHQKLKECVRRLERIAHHVRSSGGPGRPSDIPSALKDSDRKRRSALVGLESKYDTQITDLRSSLNRIREKIANTQQAIDRIDEGKTRRAFKIPKKEQSCEGFKRHINKVENVLTENDEKINHIQEENKMAREHLEDSQAKTNNLRRELAAENDKAEQATKEALRAQSRSRMCREDLDLQISHSEAEYLDLQDQLNNLHNTPEELEDQLRKTFQKQLELIIAERKRQYNLEHEEGMAELAERYKQKWVSYDRQIDKLEEANQSLKRKARAVEAELNQESLKDSPSQRLAQVRSHTKSLQQELDEANEKWQKIQNDNKLRLDKLRTVTNKKDREYDDLMDLKVALAMEIKAYKLLLDNEEDRLGYDSPKGSPKQSSRTLSGSSYSGSSYSSPRKRYL